MAFDFEHLEPIFGEAKPEWEDALTNPNDDGVPLNPFLFRVFVADRSHLKFHVTDFRSGTWEATRSVNQLEDMRDSIGIGGSWSDFMNYVISSLKSKDVKFVQAWQSKLNGATSAKLVTRKSKGMPLISITLSKLGSSAASEAMADMSLELFKAYGVLHDSFIKEQERCCQLTRVISAEKEKSQAIKRKLDAAMHSEDQGLHRTSGNGNIASSLNSDTSSVTAALNSSDKQPTSEVQSTKVAPRVVPAHRRAKVRGVVLHDTEVEERA